MFVRQSTYDNAVRRLARAEIEAVTYKHEFKQLMTKWNELVDKINMRGGESFLDSESSQLTSDEIKKLLQLCHPDKHDGKQLSVDMTQRLLELRG